MIPRTMSPGSYRSFNPFTKSFSASHLLCTPTASSYIKGLPLVGIRDAFIKGMKAAGIPCGRKTPGGLTFHDLRHTFNTNARKAGIPDKLIMKITGHSTREMFDRYNTITADEIDLVEDKMIAAAGQFVRAITQDDNT